jgi:hypothetical protein
MAYPKFGRIGAPWRAPAGPRIFAALCLASGFATATRGDGPAQTEAVAVPNGSPSRPADLEAGRWGTFQGRVVFGGDPPAPVILIDPAKTRLGMNQFREAAPVRVKDHEVLISRGPILSERLLVDRETRGVRNAFVYLAKPTAVRDTTRRASPKSVTFLADRGVFVPHVLAATQETEIRVETVNAIVYNLDGRIPGAEFDVHGPFLFARTSGQLNVMFGGVVSERSPGNQHLLTVHPGDVDPIPAKFRDNIHPWMTAYWLILDHPYFAVTDERGNFTIRDVPTGPQEVVVWHEALGAEAEPRPPARPVFRGQIRIDRDGPTTKDFTIDPRRIAPRS